MRRNLGNCLVVGVLLLSLLVSGCAGKNGMGDKQATGTAIGAVAGGIAGAFFGSGSGKVLAIAVGAAAGAALGNYIGSILDEEDQKAVAAESARTLSTADDGQTSTWSNPDSGASANITVDKTETVKRRVPIIREKYVASPGELVLINTPHEALKTSNVRSGPGTDYKVVNGVKQGEVITVVGQVKGRNWYMVGRNGRSIGYVYKDLLQEVQSPAGPDQTDPAQTTVVEVPAAEPAEPAATTVAAAEPAASGTAQQSVLRAEALDLEDIEASMNLEEEGLVAEEVEAETEVRTVTVEVQDKDGQTETNTFRASRGGDGAWEVI